MVIVSIFDFSFFLYLSEQKSFLLYALLEISIKSFLSVFPIVAT